MSDIPVTELPNETDDAPRSPGGGQAGNRQLVKAIVLGPILKQDLTTGQTKELPPDDLLERLAYDGKIIEPPFDKLVLAMLPEQSTELGPVVEAMVQNIDGFGYRLESRVQLDHREATPELTADVFREKVQLVNFFNNCCADYSFTELRKRARRDLETTGEAFWEIIRVPATNEIVAFNHIPSYQMRLGLQDKDFTTITRKTQVVQSDGSIGLSPFQIPKRLRRYVQARITTISRNAVSLRGYQVRWFKDFGDPRTIDNRNGEVVPKEKLDGFPEEHKASEIIHWKIYSPRTAYGLPRYIGNLITIFGDRAADEVNYLTLKNNNIPSMVLLVSNGQLTQGSVTRIEEFVQAQVQGSPNYSRFLILEAEGQFEGTDVAHMKLDIKPLTSEQMRDQLFQEYGRNNRDKLREAFRLPPIFTGRSDDYTRATAEASRRLADEQIFKPERDEFDNQINKLILPEMGARYHVFRSNGPNVTDDEDLIKVLQAAERTGGMTPRISRLIISDILGKESLPPLDESVPLDVPFSLTLAEAVKNQAPIESNLGWVEGITNKAKVSRSEIVRDLLSIREELEDEVAQRVEHPKHKK